MNERIKELALQAWMAERTEKDPKYKKSEVTDYLLKDMEDFHKKFAELIVRECIDKIETHQIPVGNSAAGEMACEWTYAALKEIRDEIKEHFGVEE